MASEDQGKDSFVRWQAATRDHFGSVANLLLALATGLLAFQSTLLIEKKLSSISASWLAVASLIFLSASVVFSLWCSVNRLRDFRLTTQIVRRRQKGELDLLDLRNESQALGKFTWGLFWFQIVLFGLGAGCGAFAVLIQVWSR